MKRKFYFAAICLFHLTLVLWLTRQSLWLDEAVTAVVVRDFSFPELFTRFLPHDFHPPIYYVLLKGWTNIFGLSELSLRLPSLIFTLITGLLLFRSFGIWAAAFLLLNPLVVYYSGEARMYSLSMMLVTMIFLALKQQKAFWYVLLIILAFNSFYGTVFFLAGLGLYQFIKKDWFYLRLTVVGGAIAFFMALPLLYTQWQNSREIISLVTNWRQVLGTASFKNLLLIPLKFSIGRISFFPKWLYYLLTGAFTVLVWLQLKWQSRKITLVIFPLILAWGFSLFSPLLSYFRFLYLLPFLAILFSEKKSNVMIKAAVLFGFVVCSLYFLITPLLHREDWRGLANSLPKKSTVYGIVSSLEGINYYRSDVVRKDLREFVPTEKQIYVVPYTSDIHGFNYFSVLEKANYQQTQQKAYLHLVLETWAR